VFGGSPEKSIRHSAAQKNQDHHGVQQAFAGADPPKPDDTEAHGKEMRKHRQKKPTLQQHTFRR
jgi:hypothetical protein